MRRIIAAGATTTLAIASLLTGVSATTANAAVPICDRGTNIYKWTSAKKSYVITHKKVIEHYTGGTITKTFNMGKETSIMASVNATAGAEVSGDAAILSLGGKLETSLMVEGKRTKTSSESIRHTLSRRGTYVLYDGVVKGSGYYTQYRCDGGTKWIKTGRYGKAVSWKARAEGGIRCGTSVPGGLPTAAKKFC